MNKFDKQGYVIVKGLVEKELATFLYNYSLMKRNILNVLLKTKYILIWKIKLLKRTKW